MRKKFFAFVLAIALILAFAPSCGTKTSQKQNNIQKTAQRQNNKQQPIAGVESSVSQLGDIERVKITADTSTIRSGCSSNATALQTAGKDSRLNVISPVGDWYAVKMPSNQIGFIPKQDAKPVVVEDNQPSVTPGTASGTPQPTQGNTSANVPKTPSAQTSSSTLTTQEQQMVSLVNQARAQNNLPPLQVDMQLTNVARIKAQDMIDNNYFSHNSPKYGSPFDMMKSFGIKYVYAGENIAGNQSVTGAENALMNSPEHRKNILNPNYTHIGIGIKKGGPYGNMFSQMFISKPQ